MLPSIDQIRAARALLRLSSDTVGNDLSLGQSHLTKIESGRAFPRLDTLIRLSDYYVSRGVEFSEGGWTRRQFSGAASFFPSADQLHAARVLLRLSGAEAGQSVGLSRHGLINIELEKASPRPETLNKLHTHYVSKGVEFGQNGRVRLRLADNP